MLMCSSLTARLNSVHVICTLLVELLVHEVLATRFEELEIVLKAVGYGMGSLLKSQNTFSCLIPRHWIAPSYNASDIL